ncbi:MAG TPA: mycofactocin precursor MftA [Ktedonobacteraceae bacterium]|nr:mycofactocin precursor MftA [Ktedonobacteraceae bacterium]
MAETTSVPTNEAPVEDVALVETEAAEAVQQNEAAPDDEFEEELIIEDFTIDGICGVY